MPVRHPISGKAVGAVNLTCWRKDAGRLLIALAQSTARQVTQGLLDDSSAEEFQLLREYLRACRRTAGLTPCAFAIERQLQCVSPAGFSCSVACTISASSMPETVVP